MLRRLALLFVLVLSVSACGGDQSNTAASVANAASVARIKVLSGPTGGVNSVVWRPSISVCPGPTTRRSGRGADNVNQVPRYAPEPQYAREQPAS